MVTRIENHSFIEQDLLLFNRKNYSFIEKDPLLFNSANILALLTKFWHLNNKGFFSKNE